MVRGKGGVLQEHLQWQDSVTHSLYGVQCYNDVEDLVILFDWWRFAI